MTTTYFPTSPGSIGGTGPLSGLPMPGIGAVPSGGGFNWGSLLPYLGPLIGAGLDIYSGNQQDKQAAANFAAQQQRQAQLAAIFGSMFQGQQNPYQAQLSQMLGIQAPAAQANPWTALFGAQNPVTGATPTPSAGGAQLPNHGTPPWWNPTGSYGTPSGAGRPNLPFTTNMMLPADLGGLPNGGEFLGSGPVFSQNIRPPTGGPNPVPSIPMPTGPNGGVNPNGLGYTPERIDVSQLGVNSGVTRGQDALFQMLNRDPSGQMINAQDLINANTNLFNRQTDRSADLLRGRARGLGQFAGTAAANAEALLRGDANAQLGAQNANLLYNTATGNADRSLTARGQTIGGWGTYGQLANAGQGNILQALLANQAAGNQASQFGINTYLNTLTNAAGMNNQQNQFNLGLASLFAGLPIPQQQGGGQMLGAASDAAWLPFLLSTLR